MCEGPEESNAASCSGHSGDSVGTAPLESTSQGLASALLELASSNEVDGFCKRLEEYKAKLNVPCGWYCRQHGTGRMVVEQRTPLMVAALYGSVDVVEYILKSSFGAQADVNQRCGIDGSSALHCAAAGGSDRALDVVKLLLDHGADLDILDAQGRRPAHVIAKVPRHPHLKTELERLLKLEKPELFLDLPDGLDCETFCEDSAYGVDSDDGCAPPASSLPVAFQSLALESLHLSPSSVSPTLGEAAAGKVSGEIFEKVKEYPMDPSIPDIKNSIYSSDEFRMFSFKVRPCSRAYSHDWTECPFVHPGENARRRDPRRFHYSCVPCPDFRKGSCRRGDACEYAHGVFECWLHPAQYRTRLCKDGTKCARRVCFFAHTNEELRPLYVSTGSAIPSPRTTGSLDIASMSPPLAPGSPSSALMMSPFSASNPVHHQQGNLVTPPMSPSSPSSSVSSSWSQCNIPALHLPGVGLHASRLRAALSARDISLEDDFGRAAGYEGHSVAEFPSLPSQVLSTQARLNAAVAASSCGTTSSRANKYRSLGLTVAPTNLEDLFAAEMMSSPRSNVSDSALLSPMESPMHAFKSSLLHSQLQNEMQAQLQLQVQQAALESQLPGSSFFCPPIQKSSFALGRSPALGGLDLDNYDGVSSPVPSVLSARATAFAQRDNRSHSSRDLGAGMTLSDWGSPTGKPEWGVHGDDLSKLRKSASLRCRKNEDSDVLSEQRHREGFPLTQVSSASSSGEELASAQRESGEHHSVLASWIDNLHLDHIIA